MSNFDNYVLSCDNYQIKSQMNIIVVCVARVIYIARLMASKVPVLLCESTNHERFDLILTGQLCTNQSQ